MKPHALFNILAYFALLFLLALALSSCSRHIVTNIETGKDENIRQAFWADRLHRGDTISKASGGLYVVKWKGKQKPGNSHRYAGN